MTANVAPQKIRYRVQGMDCGSCARKIETALTRVPGVSDINITTATETLRLRVDGDGTGERVEKVVRDLGYGITPVTEETRHHHDHGAEDGPWWRSAKGRLTLFCGIALAAAWGLAALLPSYEAWLYTVAMAIGLVPIARRAASAALAGAPFTIETLMSIAAVGAVIIGETEEAAIVVLLFLVGELLEGVAAGRARASIRSLTSLVPKTAFIERNGTLQEVQAEILAVGDVIAVRPGDRVPADGVIVSGESAIDEAPVTGESTPKRKGKGETVFAGTINTDGTLRVRVTAEAEDNTIARMVRLVEEAQEAKAPTERFIDRFSRYYTPAVLIVGALVAILPPLLAGEPWGEWVYKGLAVLLIGCPCALVISTPAAIAAGLAAGARRGLLIKGGAVLETLGKVTAVALDKTGTLTEGRPKVTDVVALQGTEREILEDAAALDATSSHPIAKAIVSRAQAEGIEVVPAVGVMALGGKGVKGRFRRRGLYLGSPKAAADIAPLPTEAEARISALQEEGKTVSVLLVNDTSVGLIAVRDEPREDAIAGLQALKARGITPIMLTDDNAKTAAAIAHTLGVEARADLLPQDKLRIVNELKAQGQVVAKVGDGINDAPALAAADVGIAMGGGTDVALETADGAVLHGRVLDIARMIALSKATMGNIRQNIVVALGLKAVFLVTTIIGITGLWPAILADTGATVLVTANAMRLLGFRGNA
ncbi:heavy metal translocating P-type ATPase [Microvirga arsenatis]|uniref:P-type Zn(2+) transporter n=1 Tax=Microvirga arsenatis TaxID=2692265 RepID=A0ABW9Z3Y0_9HYPH|nr:heavy metal translocating P-type ATPase [Microvirga arsenatis]NBJ12777.1 cadmium-translocating P-type ATPase [Microvirga arsenatis]NBJ26636.1 cadmium-translocating P-type ATPase [Microvirga arsenatis]